MAAKSSVSGSMGVQMRPPSPLLRTLAGAPPQAAPSGGFVSIASAPITAQPFGRAALITKAARWKAWREAEGAAPPVPSCRSDDERRLGFRAREAGRTGSSSRPRNGHGKLAHESDRSLRRCRQGRQWYQSGLRPGPCKAGPRRPHGVQPHGPASPFPIAHGSQGRLHGPPIQQVPHQAPQGRPNGGIKPSAKPKARTPALRGGRAGLLIPALPSRPGSQPGHMGRKERRGWRAAGEPDQPGWAEAAGRSGSALRFIPGQSETWNGDNVNICSCYRLTEMLDRAPS